MSARFQVAIYLCLPLSVWASESHLEKINVQTDLPALERGADALMNNCHSCHGMKYIKYRDLVNLGIDKQKVDSWRGDQMQDAPLLAQMSENDTIAAFGKVPPDLSLMIKAREGGANYLYTYLLGYRLNPEGVLGNRIYPETKMPDILGVSTATDAAQRASIQAQARDIASFLTWVSDPHEAERIRLGRYVIAYLLVLTILLYFVKNQIWSRLK